MLKKRYLPAEAKAVTAAGRNKPLCRLLFSLFIATLMAGGSGQ